MKMCRHLYGIVFDVEVAGSSAKISGGKVSSSLLEADHPGFVQVPASLHHKFLPVQLQRWIHLHKTRQPRNNVKMLPF